MRKIAILALALSLFGCDYLNDLRLKYAKFNVYYYPYMASDKGEVYLGPIRGLEACRGKALAYAVRNADNDNWDYICCLKTWRSECASKHK